MKDIKLEVGKFFQDFASAPETEKLRHAISFNISQEGMIDLKNLETAEALLNDWFAKKLYSLGRIIEEFKTIASKDNYSYEGDFSVGIGFCVEAKKDKINIARYLAHLLLLIESKDRQIKNLQSEVSAGRDTYLEMENAISAFINDETIPKDIRNRFNDFNYLLETEED